MGVRQNDSHGCGAAPAHRTPAAHEEHHRHGNGHRGHGGGHHGHDHGVSADADRRWLVAALSLITVFMAGEVAVGLIAGSLALLSDAAHMLTDAAAIVLALIAMRLAARPPRGGFTYGLKRAEILSAQANGLTLLLLGGWLAYEAVRRLLDPPEVAGGPVLITAGIGVVVNIAAAWCMSRANRTSLNVEGAFQHILNDLFAFVATLIAGLIMVLTGFTRADAIASLIVVALMAVAGVRLLRDSGRILLEAAPPGVDVDAIGAELAAVPAVTEIHDLHLWQITSGQAALSAHVLVADQADCHHIRRALEHLLQNDHNIRHTTLQVDHAADAAPHAEPHCDEAHGPTHRSTR
ncbi:putative cation transporter [Actinoplanes ianthinogenes]|uniref:Cation transporter n=1 Tax=Actinoplanes ianthinogenes TaxID=122358 RepID=A0ABM7LJM1_9ACTN|nr:cation diffusion facilitator family transporter [Actinoplanes ianthinogenes]BCJ39452.1 putative cation transporter [Actinoplanes ianthinogenes]GGR36003.1 putative cation transporter [Actinoplanes ianthinogenes]